MKARFRAAVIVVSIGRKHGNTKHGNTLIRTLRKTYGEHFAEGCRDDKMDKPPLRKLSHDAERGKLDEICPHA